jgi:dipeptide/tripeptide permease
MDASLGSMSTYMRTDGFPNDLLQNVNPLTLIIFIPLVDKLLYPGLRKIGFKMLPITRITIGFWFGVLAMAYCAIIQVIPHSRILIHRNCYTMQDHTTRKSTKGKRMISRCFGLSQPTS